MPTQADFDLLDLILDNDDAAADEILKAGWAERFYGVVRAAQSRAALAQQATSGSSNTLGLGTKIWTLDSARSYQAGTPLLAMSQTDPEAFMFGRLTINEVASVITMDITAFADPNVQVSDTDWAFIVTDRAVDTLSNPATIVQGGTGSTTAAGARTALELIHVFQILSIESTPPISPNSGDIHLVGPSATGVFATHEDEIATFNGATFDFVIPSDGEQIYDAETKKQLLFNDTAWVDLTNRDPSIANVASTTTVIFDAEIKRRSIFVNSDGGLFTITLPAPGATGNGYRYTVINNGTVNAVDVDVASGGTINGSATDTHAVQYDGATYEQVSSGLYIKISSAP